MANTEPDQPDEIAFQDQVDAFRAHIGEQLAFLENLLARVKAGEFAGGPSEAEAGPSQPPRSEGEEPWLT